jgi:hypothetical protein
MTPRGPELVISDPTGLAQVYVGSVAEEGGATVIKFDSTSIAKVRVHVCV